MQKSNPCCIEARKDSLHKWLLLGWKSLTRWKGWPYSSTLLTTKSIQFDLWRFQRTSWILSLCFLSRAGSKRGRFAYSFHKVWLMFLDECYFLTTSRKIFASIKKILSAFSGMPNGNLLSPWAFKSEELTDSGLPGLANRIGELMAESITRNYQEGPRAKLLIWKFLCFSRIRFLEQ